MLDPKYFGEKIDALIAGLNKRNADTSLVAEIQTKSESRKKAILEAEKLKALRNQATQEIAVGKKAGQNMDARVAEMRAVGDRIKLLDEEMKSADESFKSLALTLPNIPHESVPAGKSGDENKEMKKWGEQRKFSFEAKDHADLGEKLGILDFARAAKITGARFSRRK